MSYASLFQICFFVISLSFFFSFGAYFLLTIAISLELPFKDCYTLAISTVVSIANAL